jgi:hypothetical protein
VLNVLNSAFSAATANPGSSENGLSAHETAADKIDCSGRFRLNQLQADSGDPLNFRLSRERKAQGVGWSKQAPYFFLAYPAS